MGRMLPLIEHLLHKALLPLHLIALLPASPLCTMQESFHQAIR